MMNIKNYYQQEQELILISKQQASQFAKQIAHDFNPLHDVDAKRFCVPGDLLLAIILHHYGLSQSLHIDFAGMVGDNIPLVFPESAAEEFSITDQQGKAYVHIKRAGTLCFDPHKIDRLVQVYVEFSGQAFPHILVPLMEKEQVMINPDRPLVIYNHMQIELDHFEFEQPYLKMVDARLQVQGKRGDIQLLFDIYQQDQRIGSGQKSMVLSGLRPYEADKMEQVVARYLERQAQ